MTTQTEVRRVEALKRAMAEDMDACELAEAHRDRDTTLTTQDWDKWRDNAYAKISRMGWCEGY